MSRYTTLYFDLDNTLLDFNASEKAAVSAVLQEENLPCDSAAVALYSAVNRSYWERFEKGEIKREEIFAGRFETFLKAIGRQGDPERMSSAYCAKLAFEHHKTEGADEVLGFLKDRGYRLIAATNGLSRTQHRRIREAGLERFFDGVFVSEEVGLQKPDAGYYDYIIAHTPEKDRSKILIVGDSMSSDILGGIHAGIDTCWFDAFGGTKRYPPTYVIHSLRELKTLLGS